MVNPVKITSLTADELARLLSQASKRAISGQDVLAIAETAGILSQRGTINLVEFTAFLVRETAGGSD